MVVNTNLTEGM